MADAADGLAAGIYKKMGALCQLKAQDIDAVRLTTHRSWHSIPAGLMLNAHCSSTHMGPSHLSFCMLLQSLSWQT